jgi:hypothetical protein
MTFSVKESEKVKWLITPWYINHEQLSLDSSILSAFFLFVQSPL